MANSPYSAVSAITKYKKLWNDANAAGNDVAKKDAMNKAQEYYNQLKNTGYGDVAEQLAGTDYNGALEIQNKWAKTGRNSTRDYLYSLGKSYGMSSSDIDNLIKWDSDTGQVSFGGKLIGTPDAVGDGTSYWNDTKVLDDAFNDYIKRSGTTASDEVMSQRATAGVSNKINALWGMQSGDHEETSNLWKQEYNDLKETNPFTTDEAKAILAKYDLAGLQGRDNAAASGSATNGGNIDSFAAANALRQQAALVNQGQMAVLEAHNQKLEHARAILEGLGAYQQNSYAGMQDTIGLEQNEAQRLFENTETAKNNETDRLVKRSEVTGFVPKEWQYSDNPYFNENGTLINETVDYSVIVDNATEKLKTATDPTEIANLKATIKYATDARNYKMNNYDGKYAKFMNTMVATAPEEIANVRLTKEQIASAEEIAKGENATNKQIADATNATNKQIADANNKNKLDQITTSAEEQKKIAQETAENDGYKALNMLYNVVGGQANVNAANFITDVIVPMMEKGEVSEYKLLSVATDPANIKKYGYTADDLKKIFGAFGFDTDEIKSAFDSKAPITLPETDDWTGNSTR